MSGSREFLNHRFWPKTGAAITELDATLLSARLLGECRVSSEHFGQTYVSSRPRAAKD